MQMFQIFAGIGEHYLRFLGETKSASEGPSGFSLYFKAGEQEYYHTEESRNTVFLMLSEFSGTKGIEQAQDQSFDLPPMEQLVLLGACDVILGGQYHSGWFTSASIRNAWDLSEDTFYKGLCAPLAQVTDDGLASLISKEGVGEVLEALVQKEILESDETGGCKIYALAPEYQYLPALFTEPDYRLALYLKNAGDKDALLYVITSGDISWAFIMKNGEGSVKQLSEQGFLSLLETVFPGVTYCTNCGAALDEGSRFCSACGAFVDEPSR